MKLVIATHNADKLKEIQHLLHGLPYEVLSADDAGVCEDIAEDGSTLEENARKKAEYVATKANTWAIADDTGLFIDALGGKPGIYAARWAGEGASGAQILSHTLSQLRDVSAVSRTAYFESVACLLAPEGKIYFFHGVTHGHLLEEPRGRHPEKLPYDALFVPDGYTQAYAEMPNELKNKISHRARAFVELRTFLEAHDLQNM